MSTHNIGFYEDLTKIIFELSSNSIKYAPYFCCWIQQMLMHFFLIFAIFVAQFYFDFNSFFLFHLFLLKFAQFILPDSLYLAHSALIFFKIALKMLSKISFQLAHPENESCLQRTAVIAVFTF